MLPRLLLAIVVFVSLLGVIAGSLYIVLAYNRPNIVTDEKVVPNDISYSFSQDRITRLITIRRDGRVLYRFFFRPQVFAAWVDTAQPHVYLVTSDTGAITGAQGLYIYDGKNTKKVFQSRNVEFANGQKSGGVLYTTWVTPGSDGTEETYRDNLRSKKELLHKQFDISPNGKYFFGYESGYEGGAGFTIDLTRMEQVPLNFSAPNALLWSDDGTCGVTYTSEYGDQQHFERVFLDGDTIRAEALEPSFWGSYYVGTYWSTGCNGIVAIAGDHDSSGNDLSSKRTEYYRFTAEGITLTKISAVNLASYRKGAPKLSTLRNIFFTLRAPK